MKLSGSLVNGADARAASVRGSNLDASGVRMVRRGCVVVYGGLRVRVQRVRLGQLVGPVLDAWGHESPRHERLVCRSVQVVA